MIKKEFIISALIALVVASTTIGISKWINVSGKTVKIVHINTPQSSTAMYTLDENGEAIPLDFTRSAQKVMDAVVHIKSTQSFTNSTYSNKRGRQQLPDPFREFFQDQGGQ